MVESKVKKQFHLGTGRRKSSVARVRVCEGNGKITINGRSLTEFFTEDKDRNAVTAPLELTEMRTKLDVIVRVEGGGISGQSGAITQGLARALKAIFGPVPEPIADATPTEGVEPPPSMAKRLRDSGFLTRDGRMKERKKYGRKGARKSFQFSKR